MNQPYASAKGRTNWAAFFLALFGLITIASIVSTIAELDLLQRIDGGESVSRADIDASDQRQGIIGRVYALSFIAAAIAFLMWIRRSSENLAPLGVAGQRFSPGWAVGGWFVPILFWFRPYQVMAEIWRGSRPEIDPENPGAWTKFPASRLLGFWWVGWLVSNWIGNLGIRLLWSGDSAADLITAGQTTIASDIISLAALVLVVILLRRIAANQEQKHALRQNLVAQGAIVDELELLAASSGAPLALCRSALRQGFTLHDAGETLEFRHTRPPAIAREVLEREVLRRPLPPEITGQPTPEGGVSFAIPKAFLAEGE